VSDFIKKFKAARRVSTPIISVRTPDPAATISGIQKSMNGSKPPMITWDIARGARGINQSGDDALAKLNVEPAMTTNLVEFLSLSLDLAEKTIVFVANAHRVVSEQGVSQAIWNCRDTFKQNMRMLVLLSPSIDLPAEIAQDALPLDEPLPNLSDLAEIVRDVYRSAQLEEPPEETVSKAVDCLCGLAAFPAEQAAAMCLTKSGIDFGSLWDTKRSMIEATPGLSVWRGGETFEEIGGCDNAKSFLRSLLAGNDPPRGIVFIDEIEKQLAGNGTDLSGVTTEMVGQILTFMQDTDATGLIFIGPPGAAKSAMAKATGNSANVPTIQFDMGAMKSSLVGESGARLRQALKVVEAVTQGKAMWIATCNRFASLTPELKRRFRFGTFFFDLPTSEERVLIWQLYCKKFNVSGELPNDTGWTGAEIRNCCTIAYRLKLSLREAAEFIVPVAQSAAAEIETLRTSANGNFISAGAPGKYRYQRQQQSASTIRMVETGD
jgi:hypothetical protein